MDGGWLSLIVIRSDSSLAEFLLDLLLMTVKMTNDNSSYESFPFPHSSNSNSQQHSNSRSNYDPSNLTSPSGFGRWLKKFYAREESIASSDGRDLEDRHDLGPRGRTGGDGEMEREGERDLSSIGMIALTVGLAGAQLTWTVEMAYGTPYLLKLGLSKSLTSLVWVAGPLSGLIAQPLVGSLSDSSTSKFRRRKFIVGSVVAVVLATLLCAFAYPVASLIINLFLPGDGGWDPQEKLRVSNLAVGLAVFAFYVLDFGLNSLQASLRALILDVAPSRQQVEANAWHGRMTHLGNIVGFFAGYLDLGKWDGLDWVGGGQFRKLACLSVVILLICTGVTCVTQKESANEEGAGKEGNLKDVFERIWRSIVHLPPSVRKVCYVQFFAWLGWFPFLFYSTTYVVEIILSTAREPKPSVDDATRYGSFTLLLYALVALATGLALPFICSIGITPWVVRHIAFRHTDGSTAKFFRGVTRRTLSKCTPRNCWTLGTFLFGILMLGCTFLVNDVAGATVVISLVGIPWAITCWVPFALVMEYIRDIEDAYDEHQHHPNEDTVESRQEAIYQAYRKNFLRRSSSNGVNVPSATVEGDAPPLSPTKKHHAPFRVEVHGRFRNVSNASVQELEREREREALLGPAGVDRRKYGALGLGRSGGEASVICDETKEEGKKHVGGTILGIHNLSIVAPQFIVAIIAAIIFKLVTLSKSKPSPLSILSLLIQRGNDIPSGETDVVYILRFGGLMSLFAAFLTLKVDCPMSEEVYLEAIQDISEGETYSSVLENGEEP